MDLSTSPVAAMLAVTVAARRQEAEGVVSLEFRPVVGSTLPAFEAGAHIEIELPGPDGPLLRQYSLCNDPSETHRYVVAVGLDARSRGGSQWVHDKLRGGQALRISVPRNHFALTETAPRSLLIAGGIGITPMLAMARRLTALGRPWTLYYCVRTPARAAFLAELIQLGGEVIPVFDGMPGVSGLDVAELLRQTPADAHVYCCGPSGLMQAFVAAAAGRAPGTVHVEWFAAPTQPAGAAVKAAGEFTVHLSRSARTLHVTAEKSILDVVLEAGIDVPYSCFEGICGSCETPVLDGECDHRDLILADHSSNKSMMICVSRCKGEALTLDL